MTRLARDTDSWHDLPRLVDSTPLPCAASRETVKRSDLAGHAAYGFHASHSRFFWGFRLYLICTAEGTHLVQAGQDILGDRGFAGADFEAFVHDQLGAHLIRPDRKGEPARFGKLARYRQWIESVVDTLTGQPTLEEHGARTLAGVYAPPAAPVKRSLIAYDV